MPILIGLDGQRKMGKSLGNYIGVAEPPKEQFGKTMSIPDNLMRGWFELLTDRTEEEIARLTNPNLTHPKQAKETLGKDIVRFYYGNEAAEKAAADWNEQFSKGNDPWDMPEIDIPANEITDGRMLVSKLLVLLGLAKSNNEARRHIQGGAVNVGPDRQKITDPQASIPVKDGLIVRVGSRRVVRMRVK
jgi:tyrosyl-tRNA synthetase